MGKWTKGQSGNQSGKAKKPHQSAQGYARKKYGKDGRRLIDAFDAIAFDQSVPLRERLAALKELRALGFSDNSVDAASVTPIFALQRVPDLKPAEIVAPTTDETT
jgi:hypothetical protein